MFGNNRPRIGQELLDVPMGDMIRQMAFAIAEAQIVLDKNSIDVAEMMGGLSTITDELGNVTFEDSRIYFGTQKTNRASAIEIHNGTRNVQQKAEIRSALDSNNYKPKLAATPSTFNTGGASSQLTADTYVDYLGSYWMADGSLLKQVAYGDLSISLVTPSTASDEVQIPRRISMLECGFTPTFYQFVDTIIEVKISIKYTQEGATASNTALSNRSVDSRIGWGFGKIKVGANVQTAQVNASYSQKYSYSAEGSSLLRTKLVPVPPSLIIEERIRRLMEEEFNGSEA